ncbi:MAG: aminotransferase class IV [Corynebacterium glucuronolyticum]|nr:aminotransferase class IV [Mycobacteriaceae bacterium]MDY5835097.1 aminotransferase class IV [Corynebacterium glucuronolyticum]
MEGHFTTFNVLPDGHVRGFDLHVERLAYGQRSLFGKGLPDGLVDAMRELRELREPKTYRVSCYADSFNITARETPPSEPISCAFYPLVREMPRVKHDDLAPQWDAQRAVAADDAILVTGDVVTEGTMFNVGFITPSGSLEWPLGELLLGTTQQLIEGVWPSARKDIRVGEVEGYIGAIATNAARGVRLITQIGTSLVTTSRGAEVAADIARAYEAL